VYTLFQDLSLFKQIESFCREMWFQGLMLADTVVCINGIISKRVSVHCVMKVYGGIYI
jgi:hypothetical protein